MARLVADGLHRLVRAVYKREARRFVHRSHSSQLTVHFDRCSSLDYQLVPLQTSLIPAKPNRENGITPVPPRWSRAHRGACYGRSHAC